MVPAAKPVNEAQRLKALRDLDVLDTPPEQAFDDLVGLAAQICQAPLAMVSLVDAERQWFKAVCGLSARETSRDVAFCAHAILEPERTLVVQDTLEDPRFADNPLVEGAPHLRFYAGVPLVDPKGLALGTLCVGDTRSRQLSPEQLSGLEALARQVSAQLLLRSRNTELHAKHARLAESEQRLRATLETANEGVVGLDSSGRIRSANPAAERLFGVREEELVGRLLTEVTEGELRLERPCVACELLVLRGEERIPAELALGTHDVGGERCYTAFLRDVSERKEVERLKDQFVSTISHELRTPLTSIRGALRMLDSGVMGTLGEEAHDLVRLAASNTERLVRLINDVLDFEKIQAGRMVLTLEPVSAQSLCEEACADLSGLAQDHRIKLEVAGAADLRGAECLADRDRLLQVLVNLIGNAIKFSPPESAVYLSWRLSGSRLRFEVRDEGPGIEEAARARLFRRFEQLDGGSTRRRSGSGLGLAISKAIVAEHGGEIGVESEPGRGSTFWFELPTRKRLQLSPPPAARGTPVLLVEDSPDLAQQLQLVLEQAGYEPWVALSLAAAKQALSGDELPALILLDLNLPDGSGLELLEWMRAGAAREVPVVVLTGSTADSVSDPLLLDWLYKPATERRLLRAVRRAVRGEQDERPWVLVVEDDDDSRAVTCKLLLHLGARCVEARDGAEAIRLAQDRDFDLIVLDVGLPSVDGFEVVRALRGRDGTPPALLIYSGRDLDAGEREGLRLGLTRYLAKSGGNRDALGKAVVELLDGLIDVPKE
ncbi:MAG TPA: hybrid sensor histidine kinase/response regulator [Planctomycetes bacterium]|nr:hybrid sensor histidine kinase/response regulator [Planctomycetota bacterium]